MESGYVDLNFKMYFEPENIITSSQEFTNELLNWREKENNNLVIIKESMEPIIEINSEKFICKLLEPSVATQNNIIWKKFLKNGVNHSIGKTLGYKWVYLYNIK